MYRTQHIVILIALTYHSKRIQNKIRKRDIGEVWRELGTSFQGSSPIGLPSNEYWQHTWNVIYQGSSLETQHPRFSLGAGWWPRTLYLWPPIKEQIFNINHIVCINRLGTVSHSLQGRMGTCDKSPDASRGPALQVDLRIAVSVQLHKYCPAQIVRSCSTS